MSQVSQKSQHIPRATIERLSVYLEILANLKAEGTEVISSEQMAAASKSNASQIRKDLAYFGEFGVRGVGYYVKDLMQSITSSLGIDREWRAVLVGIGNMGRALLNHKAIPARGYRIVGAFDSDPNKIGTRINNFEIYDIARLPDMVHELNAEIGVIATPPDKAQTAAEYMLQAGLHGILNFASMRLTVPADVYVEYVDFLHHLYALSFKISLAKIR